MQTKLRNELVMKKQRNLVMQKQRDLVMQNQQKTSLGYAEPTTTSKLFKPINNEKKRGR